MKLIHYSALLVFVLLSGCMQATTPAPKKAMLSGIDRSGFDSAVRPQDDFFQAINGGWLDSTEIPSDQARWGSFNILHEKSQNDIRELVDAVSRRENLKSGSAAQKIRDYYNAYMDQDSADRHGIDALRDELAQIAAAENLSDIYALFGTLGIIGVDNPLGMYVFSDAKDPDTNVVYLTESGLTLPDRDYYLDDSERYATGRGLFLDYATDIFRIVGVADPAASARLQLELETRLAEAHWTREENRDPVRSYNPKTAVELRNLAPDIDWSLYFEKSLIPPRDRYIVSQPSFFAASNDILTSTPISVWQDYLAFHTVKTFAPVLGTELFTLNFEFFNKGLRGVETPRPLWKRAVASTNGNLGELLGQLYVEEHFRPIAKKRMLVLIDNLIGAYEVSIKELEWMSEETRQEALQKLAKFTPKIGYPDRWRDYSSLEIIAGDLVGNIKRARRFETQRNVNKLDRPVDKDEWFMTP
ncbi:MAG: M13 family metallopeptidase, partial [Gammaproteobacteria bacterium]|nr:M13 family metallopeptidase [Gammaproteobacteria bacterium]